MTIATRAVADGIDDRRDPRRPSSIIHVRVIRILARGNYPAQRAQIASPDIFQHIGRRKVDIICPILPRAFPSRTGRLANMLNRVWRSPNGARAGSIVTPGKRGKNIGHGLMFKAWIDFRILPARRMNHLHRSGRWSRASGDAVRPARSCSRHILGCEDPSRIIGGAGGGRCSEQELMGGKTRPLVGLEHIVRPTVLRRHGEVRRHDIFGIVDVSELQLRSRACTGAGDIPGAVHLTNSIRVRVAHLRKSLVGVAQVVLVRQGDRRRLCHARRRIFVEPIPGLDVVLRRIRRSAAPLFRSARRRTQAVEQIVRRSIFLNDHNDVLKARDLRRSQH